MGAGHVDAIIFQTYDAFVDGLDALATQIQIGRADAVDATKYIEHVIGDFEDDLKKLKTEVRETKNQIVGIIYRDPFPVDEMNSLSAPDKIMSHVPLRTRHPRCCPSNRPSGRLVSSSSIISSLKCLQPASPHSTY